MKVINSSPINPFGGLNFILDTFNKLGLTRLLNTELPSLAAQSKYEWSDLLYTFWSVYFCGGDCIEDCGGNFGRYLKESPHMKLCSPDRILDRFKELAKTKDFPKSKRSVQLHEFSINLELNKLCLSILKKIGLDTKVKHTLDYDNTMIFAKKADSARTYLKRFGYCPGVGLIGHQVVYVENINGNSGAHSFQVNTLERLFDTLSDANIEINRFRADSASYQFEVIQLLSKRVDKFYVRARRTKDLAETLMAIKDWKKFKVGEETYYRGEAEYKPFISTAKRQRREEELVSHRLIVTKCFRRDKQIDLFTNEACNYSTILTNDFELSADEIVFFYNQRGKIEKEFDVLKNDFGWNQMPFSKLEQNTVFLIFSAICRNLYHYIISSYSKQYKCLRPSYRIKKFIFRFVATPAKWIKRSRQKVLILYGSFESRALER